MPAGWREDKTGLAENKTFADKRRAAADYSSFKKRLAFFAVVFLSLLAIFAIIRFESASDAKPSTIKNELTFLNLTNGEDVNGATISRDGKYFAYSSQDRETAHLWLQQTGQTNRLEIAAPVRGEIENITFTPDSESIFFNVRERRDAHAQLFRVPTLGGVLTKILSDIDSPVSFSPDGQEIVFLRLNQKDVQVSLVIASSDGTRERVLLTRSGANSISNGVAWSPDGNLIAYGATERQVEAACTIAAINPQNGAMQTLSTEKWDACFRMAWTQDAQGLVFIGTKAGEVYTTRRDQVFYLSVKNGESRRLTTDGSRHQVLSLGITDRDEILVVPYNRSSQIWRMNTDGEARTAVQITNGQTDGRAGIAPLADGRIGYISRVGDNLGIWTVNADGTDRKQLVSEPPVVEELRAAPDGRFFVFSARRDGKSHLYRIDTNGANLEQLTFGSSYEVDSTISPDSSWIVYNSDDGSKNRILKIPSSGGEPVQLGDTDCRTPHFSPDGKFVSCVTGEKIVIISTTDGSLVKIFETQKNPILNIGARWTPDGQRLIYILYRQNVCNLWQQPLDAAPPKPLTDFTSGDIYNFAFSSDAKNLYVARGYQIRNAVLIKNFR